MPLSSFKRLANELPENSTRLLFIHNLARSGSTLVSSVLSHTRRAVALLEPRALDTVCRLQGKAWTESESRNVVAYVLRLISKLLRNFKEEPLLYAVKPTSTNVRLARLFQQIFPTSVSIFVIGILLKPFYPTGDWRLFSPAQDFITCC